MNKTTGIDWNTTGVIVVDHGSRREESNQMMEEIVRRFGDFTHFKIVEPAHMEIAEPCIQTAFDRCVQRGAKTVVVMPYFLLPGKHWHEDIPRLTEDAAQKHPGVRFMVTAPLGMHPMINQLIQARIDHCLEHAGGTAPECEVCSGSQRCQLASHPPHSPCNDNPQ